LISSGIAIALAGVAGVVIVSSYSISPNGGLRWLLVAFVVMILAGEGNINAIVPAGLILGLLEAVGVFIVGAPYRQVVALVIFIVILIFKVNFNHCSDCCRFYRAPSHLRFGEQYHEYTHFTVRLYHPFAELESLGRLYRSD
jgi:hypothetical protein